MSEADNAGGRSSPDARGWAVICAELPDLQLTAYGLGRAQRFRELKARAGSGDALVEWLSFREELRRQVRREEEYARELRPYTEAFEEAVGDGRVEPGPAEHVCPKKPGCARRAHPDSPDDPPRCELFGLDMVPDA